MKPEIVIESISNGLGSQSLYLVLMAGRGEIAARVAMTADTGAENDCLWSTGERSSAPEYFERIVVPYAAKHGIDARLVRAVDKHKTPLPSLIDHTRQMIEAGKLNCIKIPVFGSKGGRMGQSCTDRWKITAIRQEARRLGATKLITVQGIHFAEAGRRVRGIRIGKHGEWTLYQDTKVRKVDGVKTNIPIKWATHYYPLVDRGYGRNKAQEELRKEGIPYLVTSQCDFCPHNDLDRWMRHTPEVLTEIADVEASMGGKFFFTDERVPLMEALGIKMAKPRPTLEANFGCGNSICGI